MPELPAHAVDPSDEGRHEPDTDPLWNESYYLDFVADGGALAGYARIGLYPNLGVTWWTTMLVGSGRPMVASVAYDLPVGDGSGLSLTSQGHDVHGEVLTPLQSMRLRGSAPGAIHSEPGAIYRGDRGETTRIGLDLTWTTDGRPFHYDVTTRYEVPCVVRGELVIDDRTVEVDGYGQRDHSWGVRDWWAFGWCWAAARLADGTRIHFADIRIPGHPLAFGYIQPPDGTVTPLEGLTMSEELGVDGFPDSAQAQLSPGELQIEISPIAFGPVLLVAPDGRSSRFPRAAARFAMADGRVGTGWIEWNQPQPSASR